MSDAVIGYCMKCKEKREMTVLETGKAKNGVTMRKGTCNTCGGKMNKIGD